MAHKNGVRKNGVHRHVRLADLPDILTVAEAAKYLRIGRESAYAAIHSHNLPARRWGRKILIPKAALARYLETTK
ncbi:MAG: helix-turn-helix domain-containing protein [Candidatus Eremiobacter antarcticus]|nr:helix-turn-helix domain-containing protein [Candidatus Eremiobacteraeota bacterium]MBC5808825.1 helix-turn-helix domain-containing protein [Candidatus Eremiobacteraeota bacterium]